jgi:multiple sugar transport system ATP-binding protein
MGAGDITMTVVPTVIERLGAQTVAYAALDGEGENFCATLPGSAAIRADVPLQIGLHATDCHLFDESGVALERSVALTEIDLNLLDPTVAA